MEFGFESECIAIKWGYYNDVTWWVNTNVVCFLCDSIECGNSVPSPEDGRSVSSVPVGFERYEGGAGILIGHGDGREST
ncbi:hypothetical protein GN244_ATG03587 [Phytophthora infestans]|uniref:Uncharacterized protein n=1 Tax=Phytophthora infestans TaxID=4787 RepID=A0A833W494_PHYIN|nr:hypothetical protein GN244_ATG19212 [Phytophthora infestans]KAF4044131.1 hypothetical protein GN244_ATG03587 [Phytophthora infestans]